MRQLSYRPSFRNQFQSSFYVHLDIHNEIERRLNANVSPSRDGPNYAVENACICCTYELEGEEPMEYRIQICLDGNESLKRSQRVSDDPVPEGMAKQSTELDSGRKVESVMYLTDEQVNEFKDEVQRGKSADTTVLVCVYITRSFS
jgi:hypothetical protein